MRSLTVIGLAAAIALVTACSESKMSQTSPPRAADAAASPVSPLTRAQLHELVPAMLLMANGNYGKAAPTLSKFALLGDRGAQSVIGMMYYAGAGLPLNHQEALSWLRLAAMQGGGDDQATLAEATEGSLVPFPGSALAALRGEQSVSSSGPSYQSESAQAVDEPSGGPRYASSSQRPYSYADTTASARLLGPGGIPVTSQSYGSGSSDTSSRMMGPSSSPVLTDERSGQRMDTIAGGYNDPRDGTTYAQAAGGVVNTRTGEFSPTHE